jgi:HTH-type transcriptional regulator/antitoxin HipB
MLIHSSKELALLITNQRKKLKLSQTDVAKRVGLQQKTISAFENKPENMQLKTLFSILSAVNLEIKITDKNKMNTDKPTWQEEW